MDNLIVIQFHHSFNIAVFSGENRRENLQSWLMDMGCPLHEPNDEWSIMDHDHIPTKAVIDTERSPVDVIADFPTDTEAKRWGLPANAVALIKTDRQMLSPSDGHTSICVTKKSVQLIAIRYPTLYNSWQVHESYDYNTTAELKDLLDLLTKQEQADCW